MKPLSLCLVQMGKTGLEVVDSYPKVIPEEALNELAYKSMPLSCKPGDFTTTSIKDMSFSSFIFEIPSDSERNNVGSLVAIFSSSKYDSNSVKKVFSVVVKELSEKKLLQTDTINRILPNLYAGFHKGKFTIEIIRDF